MLLIEIKLRNIIFEMCFHARDTRKSHREKYQGESEKNKQLMKLMLSTTNIFTIKEYLLKILI